MKILCAEYNLMKDVAIVPMGDDVLLRNNQDFYIPDFTTGISCVPQLVVRLNKLGKSVGEKFADRYYEEIGVGIRFYADSLENDLIRRGLPAVMAASFDSSAVISEMVGKEEEVDFTMAVNGKTIFSLSISEMSVPIEKLVSLSSDFHTIKIGDYLYCGSLFRYRELKRGDRLQMYLNENQMLDFYIR